MPDRLRDLNLTVFYDAPGAELATDVLLPALGVAIRYDRVAAYFNLSSLISIATGLERLRSNGGSMRLLMGLHDVDQEIVDAAFHAQDEDLMARLRRRILQGVSSIGSELERNRVEAAAWMMRDGLLEVKCVAPIGATGASGIFHNKRLIFVDRFGDLVTATGSVNETSAGLGGNFEELTVHTSWESPDYTRAHSNRFEAVWNGDDARLTVAPIGPEFGDELLAALPAVPRRKMVCPVHASTTVEVLSESPFFALMNSSRAPLYPHQERAVLAACSRWPIRTLLADEVGLGKTYEAAAVVSFALKHADVTRVVVLAPPTLLRQWQEEFLLSFGLRFWRYDSARRRYLSPDGEEGGVRPGPFIGDYPGLAIVSRDLARGTRRSGHAFSDAMSLPDMIVLDEAHVVRKRRSVNEVRPSLVGRMVADLLERVPHALFLSATPLQTEASDLFDALELLGVPASFDEQAYARSLELLTLPPGRTPELDQVASAVNIVGTLVEAYAIDESALPMEVAGLVSARLSGRSELSLALQGQALWEPLLDSVIRLHPAALLCVRNTREALTRVGYTFPEREFLGVECLTSPAGANLLSKVDEYLTTNLGTVESELYPGRPTALGFVRSIYRQRAASSIKAIHVSLVRRLERLARLQLDHENLEEFTEEDSLDNLEALPYAQAQNVDRAALMRACAIESADIEVLLHMFQRLQPSAEMADPKLELALTMVERLRSEGKQVLVFSRYTDTIEALISRFVGQSDGREAFASYTGAGGVVSVGGVEHKGDKGLVTRALAEGDVGVVFCSDAASEGLNLQSASALINVDVPWNPARLEQRIGRIARLGQTARRVKIVNLWYPNSIEAKIYERVLYRKDIMELALGAFPEIVGSAIRNAVEANSSGALDSDVLQVLNERRTALELEALTSLWSTQGSGDYAVGTASLRSGIVTALQEIASRFGSVTQGAGRIRWLESHDDSLLGTALTLDASWIEWLTEVPCGPLAPAMREKLGVLKRGSKALTFAIKSGGWITALGPTAIPDVLRAVFFGEQPELHQHGFLQFQVGDNPDFSESSAQVWWPDPESLTVPARTLQTSTPLPDWARGDAALFFERLSA